MGIQKDIDIIMNKILIALPFICGLIHAKPSARMTTFGSGSGDFDYYGSGSGFGTYDYGTGSGSFDYNDYYGTSGFGSGDYDYYGSGSGFYDYYGSGSGFGTYDYYDQDLDLVLMTMVLVLDPLITMTTMGQLLENKKIINP